MFDRFVKKNWIYVPYQREDKIRLNWQVRERLNSELNSKGNILEFRQNPFKDLQVKGAKKRHTSCGGYYRVLHSNALVYSEGSPIRLSLFEGLSIGTLDLFYGQRVNRSSLELEMAFFSSANEADLKFIQRCLKNVRFKQKS